MKRETTTRRLLRLREASSYLSLGTRKLRSLIQTGELPVIKPGTPNTPWLVDRNDLDSWIERQKTVGS